MLLLFGLSCPVLAPYGLSRTFGWADILELSMQLFCSEYVSAPIRSEVVFEIYFSHVPLPLWRLVHHQLLVNVDRLSPDMNFEIVNLPFVLNTQM